MALHTDKTSIWEPLRTNPYFAGLSDSEWEEVKGLFLDKLLEANELLFLEGEECQGIYFVKKGSIKVFKSSLEGREQVLKIMRPGDSFNDVPVFDQGLNPASAQAMEPSTVCLLPTETMISLLRRYPALAVGIIRVFASRMRHLTSLVEDLSFRHVTGRLAKVLLMHFEDPSPTGGLRLTQQDLAAMVGTAREVVVRSLRSLESRGIIKRERHRLIVLDKEALWRLI